MMVDYLLAAGLVSLALGGLSGFLMLGVTDYPDLTKRIGIVDTRRVRQLHLDWIIMGVVMTVVSMAVPSMPDIAAIATLIGGIINPLTFIPMAFSKSVADHWLFRWVSMSSFVSLNIGLVWIAIQTLLSI